jgi:hypothetical protein
MIEVLPPEKEREELNISKKFGVPFVTKNSMINQLKSHVKLWDMIQVNL